MAIYIKPLDTDYLYDEIKDKKSVRKEIKQLISDPKCTEIIVDQGVCIITEESIMYHEEMGPKYGRINIPFKIVVNTEKERKDQHDVWSFFNPSFSSASSIKSLHISYKDNRNQVQTLSLTSNKSNNIERAYNTIRERLKSLNKKDKSESDPIRIIATRYAKGEITKKEFEQMKKDIQET